jgi:hypothetical protein
MKKINIMYVSLTEWEYRRSDGMRVRKCTKFTIL